jgi:PAS domain
MALRAQIAQYRHMNCVPGGKFETFLSRLQSPALLVVAQRWNKARGKKRMPSWTDLASSAPLPDAERTWAFAYDPKSGDFTGILAGSRYGKWVGEKFYGGHLKDIHPPANYEEAHRLLTKIVTTPLAIRTSGRLFTADSYIVTGERIALPLAEDGQTGDAILGASDYTPAPLMGSLKMLYENVECYGI